MSESSLKMFLSCKNNTIYSYNSIILNNAKTSSLEEGIQKVIDSNRKCIDYGKSAKEESGATKVGPELSTAIQTSMTRIELETRSLEFIVKNIKSPTIASEAQKLEGGVMMIVRAEEERVWSEVKQKLENISNPKPSFFDGNTIFILIVTVIGLYIAGKNKIKNNQPPKP